MTRIPSDTRDLLEKAIYFPMLVKVLEKDLQVIKNSPFKLPNPYIDWVEQTIQAIQRDLFYVKRDLKRQGIKVQEIKRDELFTTFLFVYKGYEEYHSYFNPRLKNKVENLLAEYLYKRFKTD